MESEGEREGERERERSERERVREFFTDNLLVCCHAVLLHLPPIKPNRIKYQTTPNQTFLLSEVPLYTTVSKGLCKAVLLHLPGERERASDGGREGESECVREDTLKEEREGGRDGEREGEREGRGEGGRERELWHLPPIKPHSMNHL